MQLDKHLLPNKSTDHRLWHTTLLASSMEKGGPHYNCALISSGVDAAPMLGILERSHQVEGQRQFNYAAHQPQHSVNDPQSSLPNQTRLQGHHHQANK